jgi:UDP-N-acetylmuramoyl-L-alanyl-D-glutamate--2,6-diaminopimelate ligase
MGRAAALADEAIITSDNPRSEDPYHIVDQILSGFSGMGLEPTVLIDRKEAIQAAIRRAQPGDAVIVAGKGHEREQILGDRRIPFDDAAVCREALALPAPHLARRFATAPVT